MQRTYPQPDSPLPNIGSRERAFAVFKYLLNLEPEIAKNHSLFACIVHAFEQMDHIGYARGIGSENPILKDSLVNLMIGEPREIGPVVMPGDDAFAYKKPPTEHREHLPYPNVPVPPHDLERSLADGTRP